MAPVPSFPGEVVIDGDRVVEVRHGHHPHQHDGHTVIDCAGHTGMPGRTSHHRLAGARVVCKMGPRSRVTAIG